MDISEAFRPEDITKTDFFDFVVAPDVADNNALQQFNRSMKTVGIFLESYNNNNNEDPSSERKEANNNHLVLGNGAPDGSTQTSAFAETQFWSPSSNCDKEPVRWESSMLEDLNNCWSQGGQGSNTSASKTDAENTDGAIYTLTVLNGTEQSATWYRPPEVTEEDNTNRSQSTTSTALSSHQNSLDLETFLDSIPSSASKTLTDATSYRNGYPRSTTELTTTVASNNTPLTSVVKSEFAYNDSGYADSKEELCTQLVTDIVLGNNTTDGQFNNNNDWKITDNNNDRSHVIGGMDSLLRNALQGKGFLPRYNGSHSVKSEKSDDLRRVLSSPPSVKPSSEASFSTEMDEDMKTRSPLMAVSIEGGTVVMFDGGGGTGTMLIDSDNPSSAQSMDDIFLSQLDAVSYPEDYEKLKRIENEVAESVQQYCNLDPSGHSIYIPTHIDSPRLPSISSLDHSLLNIVPSTTSKNNKKYTKRSSTSSKSPHQLQSPGSSAGIRKERSLHYCNICSKGFKDKYSVNVHIRTHTGEKPFNCSLCGKSFRQKAHLAKHYHTHLAQAKSAANGSTTKPAASKSR